MNYQPINQTPKIYWSGSPETIYKIIEMDGQIEELTNLYGYCVGIGYGKTGFNWIIGNLFNNQLEIYWCKLDFDSPENIEIIAKLLQKRSARNAEKITSRAYLIINDFVKKNPVFLSLVKLAAKDGVSNISFEIMSRSDETKVFQKSVV